MNKAERDFAQILKKYGVKLVGKYTGAVNKVSIIASCGHQVDRSPQVVKKALKRAGRVDCEKCRYKKSGEDKKLSKDEVFDILKDRTFLVNSDEYENIDSLLKFTCDCGEEFTRTFYQSRNSIKKYGRNICIDCMRKLREPPNKLSVKKIQNICKKHNAVLVSNEYHGNKKEVVIIGECGHEFSRKWARVSHSLSLYGKILCPHCGMRQEQKIKKVSKGETEVAEYIRSLGFDLELNKRPKWMKGKEIDIQIKGTSLAIEFNGEYWHCEENGTGKKYHLDKEINARAEGINLIQIFETEWNFKRDIIKSILAAKLGKCQRVFARKTMVKKISARETRDFLEKTHRQGGVGATNNSYGLFLNGELISCVCFRKPRFSKKYDFELYRFSSALNTTIIGGFQKLMAAFWRENGSSSLVSYADLRYTDLNKNIYNSNGFELEKVSPPNYYYFKQNSPLLNRVNYQKHKLEDKLDIFDKSKTEYENMKMNNFKRVWDCGAAVYTVSKT